MCIACRAGRADEGECTFDVETVRPDCPWETGIHPTLRDYQIALIVQNIKDGMDEGGKPTRAAKAVEAKPDKPRGDSGYIEPAAWPSDKDIGTLADPESTGRKRVKVMYPITVGMACEWAGLEAAGGGIHPIRGCINNPATDWHHGPDKNTLNNAKKSRGVGEFGENVHIICSGCHNRWHGKNDPTYGEYDRILDQAKAWIPLDMASIQLHDPDTKATFEDLAAEEAARRVEYEKRGKDRRGRGAIGTGADTNMQDED